jgi:hypothetical protein
MFEKLGMGKEGEGPSQIRVLAPQFFQSDSLVGRREK